MFDQEWDDEWDEAAVPSSANVMDRLQFSPKRPLTPEEEMMVWIVKGVLEYDSNPTTYPEELALGFMLLKKLALLAGVPHPQEKLHAFSRFLFQPLVDWMIPGLDTIGLPMNQALLSNAFGVNPVFEEWANNIQAVSEQEQQVLGSILDWCRKHGTEDYYRSIRRFFIDHGIIGLLELDQFILPIPSPELQELIQQAYEPVPSLYAVCPHCGWTLEWEGQGWQCAKELCSQLSSFEDIQQASPCSILHVRVRRGIQKFTRIPGLPEIRLYEDLQGRFPYATVTLYPEVDQYDIRVQSEKGIWNLDVKDYQDPSGLAHFLSITANTVKYDASTVIVIPEYRIKMNPRYVKEVKDGLLSFGVLTRSYDIMSEKKCLAWLEKGGVV